jgi:Domain of unknown function (DUF5060)/Putative collagen-binding domain of a collagenase
MNLHLVSLLSALTATVPAAAPDAILAEADGVLAIEAEHFQKQTLDAKRAWHITSPKNTPAVEPDGDPAHLAGASGGAYIELLPDTRRSHDDKLINGENFINHGGKMAVLHYRARFSTPGRYYVWVRAYSTTTEDNGLHFGIDGQWPESGARWQTVKKNGWHWDCKQRTEAVHVGVPMQLWLDVEKAGEHEILMSMREDGIEVDKLVLAKDREWTPDGVGPAVKVAAGKMPEAFAFVAAAAEAPAAPVKTALVQPRKADGSGTAAISGELKQWHKVTLTLDGPFAHERDNDPNPYTDLALNVTFTHESGAPRYTVPGYFAADGDAGNSSADSGTKWRAHLSPDKAGKWNYAITFTKGKHAALDGGGTKLSPFDGVSGSFNVGATDKTGRDFRAKGRLQYVGGHYLQFAGSKEYFLKAGADAPETMLAYKDFDGTVGGSSEVQRPGEAKPKKALKTWEPHLGDWKAGDPTWNDGKGKGLIGAINYLAGKGVNAFSFLPYNAGGDGDNVWPFVERNDKLHYDCSKLDQWGVVFDHGTALGMYLHFKTQENEMDDDRRGHKSEPGRVPESLDGGKLGPERKLYCRELIARFGHALALNWNIGEENTQSTEEIADMARYLRDTDPYKHNIVIHTFPDQQDKVYPPLLGKASELTGASLQNGWSAAHQRTLKWINESAKAGKPWVVANDEQNPAGLGVPQDIGYKGTDGLAIEKGKKGENPTTGDVKSKAYTMHDIRKLCLWGTLMAGGAGVEYYFGYALPENDLVCEDFRSRDKSWDYCRFALEFFPANKVPFWEMKNADALVGNAKNDNSKFCLAKAGEVYLVYLPKGGTTDLDLTGAQGGFKVSWFNPRTGGALAAGTVESVNGGGKVALGNPPGDAGEDWLAVIRKN